MAGKSLAELTDLLALMQEKIYPFNDEDFAMVVADFPVMNDWMSERKRGVQSGTTVVHPVTLESNRNTSLTKLYEEIAIGQREKRIQLSIGWSFTNNHYLFEEREKLVNRGASQIFDHVRERRRDTYYGMAQDFEAFGFGVPLDAADDRSPVGMPGWIVKADKGTAAGTKGFIGQTMDYGNGSDTTTTIGNQNRSSHDMLKNYAYVIPTNQQIDDGFIKTVVRRTFHDTMFKAPRKAIGLKDQDHSQVQIYTGLPNYEALENLADTQFGVRKTMDLTSVDGDPMYKRVPFVRAPELDDDTSTPFYGVDHRHFKAIVMEGEWMNEHEPMVAGPERHRTVIIHIDSQFAYFCKNLRHGGFCIHRYRSA